MSAKTEKDVAGKALYLEFRKDNYTYQFILTPECVDLAGNIANIVQMSRRISTYHPRKNWLVAPIGRMVQLERDPDTGEFAQVADVDTAKSLVAQRIYTAFRTLSNQLFERSWTLHKAPIVVEVTYKDIATAQQGKMSNDLFRRIQRTREADGWGESFFNPVAE